MLSVAYALPGLVTTDHCQPFTEPTRRSVTLMPLVCCSDTKTLAWLLVLLLGVYLPEPLQTALREAAALLEVQP